MVVAAHVDRYGRIPGARAPVIRDLNLGKGASLGEPASLDGVVGDRAPSEVLERVQLAAVLLVDGPRDADDREQRECAHDDGSPSHKPSPVPIVSAAGLFHPAKSGATGK